ncbi:MAG: (Fe-S)-binding protein [Desulfobacteraceae bacterium]|jgi:heterodisulfide reductase subunit D|nr:MAG: (Fe-S)-binding protein [Desulfobacteraceae bacterium]
MNSKVLAGEFNQCIKCGLCQAACPVSSELMLEKFTPRGKVQLARFYAKALLPLTDNYRDIFSKCLLCGSCNVTCPSGVDIQSLFIYMRAEIARCRGVHPAFDKMIASLEKNKNISGEDNMERGDWTDQVPFFKKGNSSQMCETIYFVGCVSSFFPMAQKIPENLCRIMISAGEDFAVLGGDEWCCGFPLLGAGLPEKIRDLAHHNIERVKAMGARKIIFSCPSCYRVWKEIYQTDLSLYSSAEFLEQLVLTKRIVFKELPVSVTYHDPCDLGRNTGIFDPPRNVLKAVPGLRLVEMENNKARSLCCGGGGNLESADPELSSRIAVKKIEEVLKTGTQTVITSCQQCLRSIKGRATKSRIDLKVLDLTDIVLKAMSV